jgi:calcium homeostasis ER protein
LYEFYKTKLKDCLLKKNQKVKNNKQKRSRRNSTESKTSSSGSSRSPSKSRSRDSSGSPKSHSGSRNRSRSPKSRTKSPHQNRSIRRSRSRSLTPPSFNTFTQIAQQEKLDQSNRGHQLLQKMGWSGNTGLGRNEQGIFIPIEGGEVRDRVDMYKGVGANNDPFEQFRRNRSQTYIQRIRTRDDDSECTFFLFEIFK